METTGPGMLLLLHLHLVVCVSLPAPSNVSISSFNMEHTLRFRPGLGTPPNTCFTVQTLFRLRKKTWRPVAACLKLAAGQTCDLTRAFKDPLNHYQARVQAFTPTQTSDWTSSGPFWPLSDTVLGPPDVSVSGCGNCLLLQLRAAPASRLQPLTLWYRRVVLHVRRSRDGVQFNLSLPYQEENMISYLQSVHVVFSLLGAFCLLAFLLIGLGVCAGRLCIILRRRPLQRALSYGSAPIVVSDEISALQQRQEGSADCLLHQEGSADCLLHQEGSADCLLSCSEARNPNI
ncbi:Interferon alpha/beta receptor 2 [Liparis tanakae]|uniref:Interferon alpha/beta receptor 2 n=1 Tax=Liparis tanakae TaxID=230148 RepID=A0A4Z2GJT8_9TELE|nr:Interferon alpha/beta receptor 2 [Liparis tanakae]